MKTKVLLPVVVAGMLLSGCGSAPPIPEDHYYRLAFPQAVRPADLHFGRPVRVLVPEADSLYHGRALLYTKSESPLELHRYRYRFWTAPPPRLLVRLTRELLGEHAAEPGQAALELALRVRHFEAELGTTSRARLEVAAVLRDPQAGCVLFGRVYRYAEPVRGQGFYPLVEAFQRAAGRYLSELAGDLASAPSDCAVRHASGGPGL